MEIRRHPSSRPPGLRRPGLAAAVTAIAAGWLLALLPPDPPNALVRWSLDLLQIFLPATAPTNVIIVSIDEQALQNYGLKPGQVWPRAIHARLLDRLTRDQPRVVVFDVMMTQAGDPSEDERLARAIGRNGRVVLAADRVKVEGLPRGYTIVPPLEPLFETNAAAWGTAKAVPDPDRVARRYTAGDDQEPGLVWAAAAVAGAPVAARPERRQNVERWLNYYGSPRPFQRASMSYTNAETRDPGFFRDKAVFIGGQPDTLTRGEETDVFASPFTKWNGTFIPGVEVTAIAYANLVDETWLQRLGRPTELILLVVTGAAAGWGLRRPRPRAALMLAALGALVAIAAAIALVLTTRFWFPWIAVSLVQIPVALFFRLGAAPDSLQTLPSVGENAPTSITSSATVIHPAESAGAHSRAIGPGGLDIPDHTLLRCIGEGAYGQVWIARNAIGLHHAVKVIYRNRFGTSEPYERAVRGIQKFMPVSRSHEGFVHILHVGRNEPVGFFYYIMEIGDDVSTGQQFDPATYAARTLACEVRTHGPRPPRECLDLLLALSLALDRLHQHQLIHRDIKPANIIFVHGRPKLADIDLVTNMVTDTSPAGAVSHIGTEGYLAPEGPGSAAADVFSLGRVLYVALTGKAPAQCPELPTHITSHPDCALVMALNRVVCKACEFDLARRYPSADRLRADLLEIARQFPG